MDSLRLDVGVIKSDLTQLNKTMDKFGDTTAKLSEVLQELSKMIHLHDIKIDQIYNRDSELDKKLESRTLRQLANYNELKSEILDLKENFSERISSLERKDEDVIRRMEEMRIEAKSNHEEITKKLEQHEKIRWIVVGGVAVFVFIAPYLVQIIESILNR